MAQGISGWLLGPAPCPQPRPQHRRMCLGSSLRSRGALGDPAAAEPRRPSAHRRCHPAVGGATGGQSRAGPSSSDLSIAWCCPGRPWSSGGNDRLCAGLRVGTGSARPAPRLGGGDGGRHRCGYSGAAARGAGPFGRGPGPAPAKAPPRCRTGQEAGVSAGRRPRPGPASGRPVHRQGSGGWIEPRLPCSGGGRTCCQGCVVSETNGGVMRDR